MRQPNGRNFPLAYLLMGSPGLLANRPTSRREHAILVTRDGVECFEVFRGQRNADHDHGDSKMRLKFIRDRATAPVLTSDPRDSSIRPRMEHDRSPVPHSHESGARARTNP